MILQVVTRVPGCRDTCHSGETWLLPGQLARKRGEIVTDTHVLRAKRLFHKLVEGAIERCRVDAKVDAMFEDGMFVALGHLMDVPDPVLKASDALGGTVPVDADQLMHDCISRSAKSHAVLKRFQEAKDVTASDALLGPIIAFQRPLPTKLCAVLVPFSECFNHSLVRHIGKLRWWCTPTLGGQRILRVGIQVGTILAV